MSDIRKQPYRPAPGLVPEELSKMEFQCPSCNTKVQAPWTKKLPYPSQPIMPNVGDGCWVPASIPIVCPTSSCKKEFDVEIPWLPNKSKWTLYGDEACRYVTTPHITYSSQPLHFFCITLVGLHRNKRERVRRQIERLKKSIAPTRNPETWQHHFTDVWGSKPSSGEFTLKTKDAKIRYAKEFAKIICKARPELATYNMSGCIFVPDDKWERRKQMKVQKEDIFCQSLLTTLKELRMRHHDIRWIFDNIKDTTKGSKTEGWASECFLGLQYTRLFTWLSSGAYVEEPKFVTPGSHYLLEIAGFISYCVARDFEKAVQNSQSEFPSRLLGKGLYQGVLGDGSVQQKWHHGLPLKSFYGIK